MNILFFSSQLTLNNPYLKVRWNKRMMKRPLIFIPRIMASKLAIKEGDFLDSFWPPIRQNFHSPMP